MASGGGLLRRADGGETGDSGDWDDGAPATGGPSMSLGYTPPTMSGLEPPPPLARDDAPEISMPAMRGPAKGASKPSTLMNPHSEIVADRGGMGPPAPPPPAQTGSRTSHDADFDKYMDRLHPSQPDPWLDLALAGFAMASGKSPHALENIGSGAAKGMAAYIQQKQEANKEGLQAGETAARLADTAAYRENTSDWRNRQVDVNQQKANTYADRVASMNAVQSRKVELQAQGLDETAAHHQAMEELGTGKLDAYVDRSRDQLALRTRALDQGDQRLDLSSQGRDLRKQQIQNTQDYRQTQADLAQTRLSQSQQQSVLTRAVTLAAATGMPLAKAKAQIMQEFPNAATPPAAQTPAAAPPPAQGQGGFQFPP
jgi:hypothetical protein